MRLLLCSFITLKHYSIRFIMGARSVGTWLSTWLMIVKAVTSGSWLQTQSCWWQLLFLSPLQLSAWGSYPYHSFLLVMLLMGAETQTLMVTFHLWALWSVVPLQKLELMLLKGFCLFFFLQREAHQSMSMIWRKRIWYEWFSKIKNPMSFIQSHTVLISI